MSEGFFSRWSRRKSGKEKELHSPEDLVKTAPAKSVLDSGTVDKTKEEIQTAPPVTLEDVEKSIDLPQIFRLHEARRRPRCSASSFKKDVY